MNWRRSGLLAVAGALIARWYFGRLVASADAADRRGGETTPFFDRLLHGLRHRRRKNKIADSTGAAMTGGELLTRSLVLRRLLRRHALQPDEQHVGLLLPPTCAAIAANVALTLDRRVAVNLNYTLTSELLNSCIAQAGIRHVVTSRRFMERMPFNLDAELVYLEDYREKATPVDKVVGALQGYLLPIGLLQRLLGLHRIKNDDVLTVVQSADTTVLFRVFETTSGDGLFSVFDNTGLEVTRFTSVSGGKLSIGCNSPEHDLDLSSNAGGACNGGGSRSFIDAGSTSFTASSSRTLKENLMPVQVPNILDKISSVGVYNYDFIDGPKNKVGLMAEDFHTVLGNGSDKLINGQDVEMALWLAVQELTARNKELATRLADLEARLATDHGSNPQP